MLNWSSRRTFIALPILVIVLAIATADRPMAATEVDALAGGGVLVDALFDPERDDGDRLRAGFHIAPEHPRGPDFSKRRTWRRQLVEGPLPRWTAGIAILSAPGALSDRDASHWMASLLMSLAAFGALWLLGGGSAGLMAAGATLASSAALDAAGGSGAAAISALSMVGLLLAFQRFITHRGGALPIGLTWGLLLACHPAALFLVVPLFTAVAIAWQADLAPGPPPVDAQTAFRLPAIPPQLLLTPVIAIALLIAIWPALWSDTTRGLATWLTDTWWAIAPDQSVAGMAYSQPASRAPQAFTATFQWLVWTPWPLLLAWCAGLGATLRAGRDGLWFPVLVIVTVLLVGGADGGLFGARRSLLPWLWVCTAVTAGIGLNGLGRRGGVAVVTACLAWSLVADPWGANAAGAAARGPTPVVQLKAIALEDPGARVHVTALTKGQRHAVETLAWRGEIDVRWSDAVDANWTLIVGEPATTKKTDDSPAPWWSEQGADWQGQVAGVWVQRHRRR